ncbi:hypothetical protein [Fibrella arboris]|uniref:hypothetical protein n=1 Tax=Fibrella arboris TaxID=3242486 RepID=UPI003522F8D7
MEYDIRLSGAEEDNGTIEFDRLTQLANSIKSIARGALQIRLNGFSRSKGQMSNRLQRALKIQLVAIQEQDSTILRVRCDPFGETMNGIQGDLFNPAILATLPTLTPVSLFMEAFREAVRTDLPGYAYDWLDRPLLTDLKNFRKLFLDESETIQFANRGSVPDLVLHTDDFQRISTLEDLTPESREVMVTGRLDELKYNHYRVRVETAKGVVNGVLKDTVKPEHISSFWGRQVTLAGKGHYKPGGNLSFIEVSRVMEASQTDALFVRPPHSHLLNQQIELQLKGGKSINRLADIVGEWPGDEPLDELLSQLVD